MPWIGFDPCPGPVYTARVRGTSYDPKAAKRTVSLTINSDLYAQAKKLGINASQVAEQALIQEVERQRNVQVHRFITRGTFEERIDAMIRSKRKLADMAVGSGETWIGQLPPHELRTIFQLG